MNYKKYLTVSPPTGGDLGLMNTIKGSQDWEKNEREPRKVTELKDGTLLIEVANEQQSNRVST